MNATMVGTIFDVSSAAIPQAKVTVTNKGTNVARTVTGNERGDYTITNLAPGFYQLVAEHEGFRRTVVGEIELLVNQTARIDLALQVGAVSETVEVSGAGQLVESETSSIGQMIERNLIADLPLKGRAVFELACSRRLPCPLIRARMSRRCGPCPAASPRPLSRPEARGITTTATSSTEWTRWTRTT